MRTISMYYLPLLLLVEFTTSYGSQRSRSNAIPYIIDVRDKPKAGTCHNEESA